MNPDPPHPDSKRSKWSPTVLIRHAERSHSRLPGIRKVPLRAIAVILFVGLINVVVWIATAIVLVCLPPACLSVSSADANLVYVALLSVCFDTCYL